MSLGEQYGQGSRAQEALGDAEEFRGAGRSSPRGLVPEERRAIWRGFRRAVNMTPKDIERWLENPEAAEQSPEVRATRDLTRRILELRRKRKPELSDEDFGEMRKVIGHVHRHASKAPLEEPALGRWRDGLMSWGHDPLKKSRY
jgi:hypothetical protein